MEKNLWEKIEIGSTVAVKEKFGTFQGVVLAKKHGMEKGGTFTVRATVKGVGVEKVYPVFSPNVLGVKVVATPKKVRRSKIYYLRNLSKKQIRKKTGIST